LLYGFVYAVMYVLPHYWKDLPAGEVPLAIGLFNSIQLSGGAVVAIGFGWVVAVDGYAIGWEYLAAAMVVSLLVLLALGPTPGAAEAGPPAAEGSGPRAAPGP
jgi:hypothetical protein